MAANSTAKARPNKPAKPYPGFPLGAHASGRWCKRIRGNLHYFGRWASRKDGKLIPVSGDGWKEALELYQQQRDALYAGREREPEPVQNEGLTVQYLVNSFLTSKQRRLKMGKIKERTFHDYYKSCEHVVQFLGKTRQVTKLKPDDFGELCVKLSEGRGTVALNNEVSRVRILFKHAYTACLIDKPVRYGDEFQKATKKELREARYERTRKFGKRKFEPDEIRQMLAAASPALRAMILLGINCGMGQSDCAEIPFSAIDMDAGWLDFPRPKTSIDRRCPLWPETIDAIQAAIAARPRTTNREDADLIFLTKYGNRWVRTSAGVNTDSVAQEFRKLRKNLKLKGRRGFYAIRHTFQTIAERSSDMPAVKFCMGHVDDSMSELYREGIDDDRLQAVVAVVHQWLFPECSDDE